MEISNRKIRIIEGALNNMFDKIKTNVQRERSLPSVEESFHWFLKFLPEKPTSIASPLDGSNRAVYFFEAIFFFNHNILYVKQNHRFTEYRGHPFWQVSNDHIFLNEINPQDDQDNGIVEYIGKKFGLRVV